VWLDDVIADAHAALLNDAEAEPGRRLLSERGVPQEQWIRERLGFAHRPVKACSREFARWSGSSFSRRLVFPLYSTLGGVIGLQTRPTTEKFYQTYIEPALKIHPVLFGLPNALPVIWDTRQVVIVEGVFDQLAMTRHGIANAVAVMTANVPVASRVFFSRYTRRVTALLDMDKPGRVGASRLQQAALREESYTVVIPTYSAHDPDDWCKSGRVHEIQHLLQHTHRVV